MLSVNYSFMMPITIVLPAIEPEPINISEAAIDPINSAAAIASVLHMQKLSQARNTSVSRVLPYRYYIDRN